MGSGMSKMEKLKSIDHQVEEQIELTDTDYIIDHEIHTKALLKSQQTAEKYMEEMLNVATLQERMAMKLDEITLAQERVFGRINQNYNETALKQMEWELTETKKSIERLVQVQQKRERYFLSKISALEERLIHLEQKSMSPQSLINWEEVEDVLEQVDSEEDEEYMPF